MVFFSGVLDSAVEFRKAFCRASEDEQEDFKMSSLLVWVRDQQAKFLERVEKQIFSPSTPLEVISVCVEVIRKQCSNLREAGLDLLFLVDSHLRRNVERTVSRHNNAIYFLQPRSSSRFASTGTSTWMP